MDTQDTANLVYLIVLLCAVGGIFFGTQRRDLGQMAKYTLIWGGIFLALLAGVQLILSFSA
jgi:aspartyl protease family protein